MGNIGERGIYFSEKEIDEYIQNTCIECFRSPGNECDIEECIISNGRYCE